MIRDLAGTAALLLALIPTALGGEPAGAEPPPVPPDAPPRLGGIISPEEVRGKVVKVLLLDRDVPQEAKQNEVEIKTCPVEYDPKTGRFEARGLPEGMYDLYVELEDGVKYEGADLRPSEGAGEFTADDREAVEKRAFAAKSFYDERRILQMRGNGEWAKCTVELIRRGRTSLRAEKPFVVWRVEVWTFHKLYGAWGKEEYKALRRFRPDAEAFDGYNWVFLPELGGIELRKGRAAEIAVDLAGRLDPAFGRVSPDRAKRTEAKRGE